MKGATLCLEEPTDSLPCVCFSTMLEIKSFRVKKSKAKSLPTQDNRRYFYKSERDNTLDYLNVDFAVSAFCSLDTSFSSFLLASARMPECITPRGQSLTQSLSLPREQSYSFWLPYHPPSVTSHSSPTMGQAGRLQAPHIQSWDILNPELQKGFETCSGSDSLSNAREILMPTTQDKASSISP